LGILERVLAPSKASAPPGPEVLIGTTVTAESIYKRTRVTGKLSICGDDWIIETEDGSGWHIDPESIS
jgi:hypothetical protein